MKTFINFLETTEHRWMKSAFWDVGKYVSALQHIEEHKPKFIVEYGGGQSTFMLTEFVNYLNYGGKVVGYEHNSNWYNDHIENGWNEHNNIKLVDIVEYTFDGGSKYHNIAGVRYVHSMEDIEGVDFVIIDGPDLHPKHWKNNPNTTFNLMDIVNHIGYEIPFFIDGRKGTRDFYTNNKNLPNYFFTCNYKTDIGDIKNANNS